MHQEQRQQTQALLKEKNIDRAIFARRETITWLTGFNPPMQVGLNLFSAGNPLLWYEGGRFTLIVVNQQEGIAAPFAAEPDGGLITYDGYTLEPAIASPTNLVEKLRSLNIGGSGKIGVERAFVSDLVAGLLDRASIVAIDGWLEPFRAVKTAEEIDLLHRNFALTDIGHAAARAAVAPGKREIDIWNAAHGAIQAKAGRRVPIGNDCVVGSREQNIGGWPEDRELHPGESIIVDISVILDGYWSDSCATYYAGERSAEKAKLHHTVREALSLASSLLRPGAVAGDVDRQVREFLTGKGYQSYPHHTGHGVGTSGHESPRLVPGSPDILQPGNVVAVEPGIYLPREIGIRLEDVFLITPTGAEVLTHHDKD
jgi:Xaa-Pro aminopeptidase